jgi:hypothetical protein
MKKTTSHLKTIALFAAAMLLCGSAGAAEWVELAPASELDTSGLNSLCDVQNTWCVSLETDDDGRLELIVARSSWTKSVAIPINAGYFELENVGVWPQIYEVGPDRILAGVELTDSAFYAGGGGSADWLALYDLSGPAVHFGGREVLRVPMSSSISIRACFNEDDVEKRLDACHDEYSFAATLNPGEGGAEGVPDLLYSSVATTYPGPVSRTQDSTTAPPLTEADLVEVRQEKCSYQRVYQFDIGTGTYEPDKPEPNCDDFTAP